MKDALKDVINSKAPIDVNVNKIREYIQSYFLFSMYKKKLYTNIVFCGGTALRFLYRIRRFSEDLDFSLSYKANKFDFKTFLSVLKDEFIDAGFKINISYSSSTSVYNSFFKFPGLLYEYNLSPNKNQNISIKIEIDTNPPPGGNEKLTLYNDEFMFYMLHYDLNSLFAGKVHALLCRKYTKGRDWYDLLWYLSKFKDIAPNFAMLNAAMRQTSKDSPEITETNWKQYVKEAIDKMDSSKAQQDVSRFLESPEEKDLITKENLTNLLII